MVALLETRDGCRKWMEVAEGTYLVRTQMIPDMSPLDLGERLLTPYWTERHYEFRELRMDVSGRRYMYFLERLKD